MPSGIIKSLTNRGFGFIRAGDGYEYFFHRDDYAGNWSELINEFESHRSNPLHVNFEEVVSPKGPRASNVVRI